MTDVEIKTEYPLLWDVLREIGRNRQTWEPVFGPCFATLEVWFACESWYQFLTELDATQFTHCFGCISMNGESYGAVCAGAECFCLSKVPVEGDFQIRLRIDR